MALIEQLHEKYILMLKAMVSSLDEQLPSELVYHIIRMIWQLNNLTLDKYFEYETNRNHASTLTLRDIVEVISDWGTVKIIQNKHCYSFHIKFHNDINFQTHPTRIDINLNTGTIFETPFQLISINECWQLSQYSIYVVLDLYGIQIMSDNLYDQIEKDLHKLSKYYIKFGGCYEIWYEFNRYVYPPDHHKTKEIKRKIIITWLSHSIKQIINHGLYIDNSEVCKCPTVQEIIATNPESKVIY